jgi:hypothetical protein
MRFYTTISVLLAIDVMGINACGTKVHPEKRDVYIRNIRVRNPFVFEEASVVEGGAV